MIGVLNSDETAGKPSPVKREGIGGISADIGQVGRNGPLRQVRQATLSDEPSTMHYRQ